MRRNRCSAAFAVDADYQEDVIDIGGSVAIGIAISSAPGTDDQQDVIHADYAVVIKVAWAWLAARAGVLEGIAAAINPTDPDVVGIVVAEGGAGDNWLANTQDDIAACCHVVLDDAVCNAW